MSRIYVSLDNEPAIVQKIYQYTAGYPALIQCICSLILNYIGADRRTIVKPSDIAEVLEKDRLQIEIQQSFLSNVTGLSLLVLFEIFRCSSATVSRIIEQIKSRHLLDVSASEIDEEIMLLRQRGVISLNDSKDMYELGNTLIKNCLKQIGDFPYREKEAIKQYLESFGHKQRPSIIKER